MSTTAGADFCLGDGYLYTRDSRHVSGFVLLIEPAINGLLVSTPATTLATPKAP